jgi:hypothetical protein
MRARLVCMDKEIRKTLGLHLWSIFPVNKIVIYTHGRKYPSESKWVYCDRGAGKETRFLWYEVELINQ